MKLKLVIPLSILAIIFLFSTSSIIFHHYKKTTLLESLNTEIVLATKLSEVLHEIQRERGISVVYIGSKGEAFQMQLELQKETTDDMLNDLQIFLNQKYIKGQYENITSSLDGLLKLISKLNRTREHIIQDKSYDLSVVQYYSQINSSILQTIIEVSKVSQLPKITQNIIAYSNFLYFKEYAAIERAIGISIITGESDNKTKIIKLNSNFEKQKHSKEFFEKYISKEMIPIYSKRLKHKSFQVVKQKRKILLEKKETAVLDLSAYSWFEYATNRIDQLHIVGEYLYEEIISNIQEELESSYVYFIIFGALNILTIVLFVFLIALMYKIITNEQKLKIMMDKYIISSTSDLDGVITGASDAFCKISGYTEEELIGNTQNISRHPDMPKEVFVQMWHTVKDLKKTWTGKIKNRKKNGDYYWVYANIEPIFDEKGEIESYASIRLDITETEDLQDKINLEIQKNKQKDKAMQQQSRLAQMGEMISMIAHQWRQPLTAISATSGGINIKAKLNKLDNNTAIELSSKIMDFSQHLSTTIDDFREFFKSNKKKKNTTYSEVIKSVLNIVEPSLVSQNIKIIKNFNSDTDLYTYPNELKQVILNLIKNAEDILIERNIQNPIITIEAKEYILNVRDNAGGIPEDILDKVFDPYFSTKTKKDGTGLGLYMSKIIIEEHCNGKLSIYNDNHGAVFRIDLTQKMIDSKA
ncbi:MAG: nitrate- and nitrite sensing domain-containing protein [Campylobacterota bacterium]|nr:nitrate- and nitrite sensing domain-containing protein [Campylobacterota bacterium]